MAALTDDQIRDMIFCDIVAERARQDIKWGPRNKHDPARWLVILMEEVGEVSNALLDHDPEGYYTEFIHVAAVAVAALECWKASLEEHKDGR